jgi:hypothetical protein
MERLILEHKSKLIMRDLSFPTWVIPRFLIQAGQVSSFVLPVPTPLPTPNHYPLLPPPLLTKLLVPDHSLYLAGREWSGTEIVILSERLQYLVARRRG